jgi:hypothetical protein
MNLLQAQHIHRVLPQDPLDRAVVGNLVGAVDATTEDVPGSKS